jgi:hypothetical protein
LGAATPRDPRGGKGFASGPTPSGEGSGREVRRLPRERGGRNARRRCWGTASKGGPTCAGRGRDRRIYLWRGGGQNHGEEAKGGGKEAPGGSACGVAAAELAGAPTRFGGELAGALAVLAAGRRTGEGATPAGGEEGGHARTPGPGSRAGGGWSHRSEEEER